MPPWCSRYIREPAQWEARLNNIPGLVTVGSFALCLADVLLLGTSNGVREFKP